MPDQSGRVCSCGHDRDNHACSRDKCSFDRCPCWQFTSGRGLSDEHGTSEGARLHANVDVPMSKTNGHEVGASDATSKSEWPGLGEEWRPWCCPEPRCTPVHTLSGSEKPLSEATPGESFFCFGAAPTVEFVYDGVKHVNDTRSCSYTALKGVISYQENSDDWRAIAGAYDRAQIALRRFRNGDEGVRNV